MDASHIDHSTCPSAVVNQNKCFWSLLVINHFFFPHKQKYDFNYDVKGFI